MSIWEINRWETTIEIAHVERQLLPNLTFVSQTPTISTPYISCSSRTLLQLTVLQSLNNYDHDYILLKWMTTHLPISLAIELYSPKILFLPSCRYATTPHHPPVLSLNILVGKIILTNKNAAKIVIMFPSLTAAPIIFLPTSSYHLPISQYHFPPPKMLRKS